RGDPVPRLGGGELRERRHDRRRRRGDDRLPDRGADSVTALDELFRRELERFEREHPRSRELAREAEASLLAGVPMPWMVRWAGGFPIFAADAEGARFRDVDGREYVDFCLGDTAAMTGHSPAPTVRAVPAQARRGSPLLRPRADAPRVREG